MATFIPEWTGRLPAHERKMKEKLAALDAAFVVRRPIAGATSAPHLFIQHPTAGWLAVAASDAPLDTLQPNQLFAHENRAQLEQLLARLQAVDQLAEATPPSVAKMMVLWSCAPEEAALVARWYARHLDGAFVSRSEFLALSPEDLTRRLAPVSAEQHAALLAHHFPESEIPPALTTRRALRRDNTAKLARLFLDTQQEWAAKLDLDAPRDAAGGTSVAADQSIRLVNGVAGSGKTLILLSRAMLLARRWPGQQILLTSHNTPIVADLQARMRRGHGQLPRNLAFRTFYQLASEEWTRLHGRRPVVPVRSRVIALIEAARTRWPDLRLTNQQVLDEMEFIDEALLHTEAQYLEANRTGRVFQLTGAQRSKLWQVRAEVLEQLAAEGKQVWSSLPREICASAAAAPPPRKYDHILIDEAQFFAPSWFETLKRFLADDGHLFLCADPNQGFLRSRLSWKRAGLEVTGRTKKLLHAYRNTRALLEAAHQILPSTATDDRDEFLQPDFTNMEPGVPPILVRVDSPQDAVDRVANEIAELTTTQTLRLLDILVVYGATAPKELLYQRLCTKLGATRVWWLNKDDQKRHPPAAAQDDYLRLAYLDSATGLEATAVFLLGAERLLTATGEDAARKLYMAMTRAAQRLVVVSAEDVPERIAGLFQRME